MKFFPEQAYQSCSRRGAAPLSEKHLFAHLSFGCACRQFRAKSQQVRSPTTSPTDAASAHDPNQQKDFRLSPGQIPVHGAMPLAKLCAHASAAPTSPTDSPQGRHAKAKVKPGAADTTHEHKRPADTRHKQQLTDQFCRTNVLGSQLALDPLQGKHIKSNGSKQQQFKTKTETHTGYSPRDPPHPHWSSLPPPTPHRHHNNTLKNTENTQQTLALKFARYLSGTLGMPCWDRYPTWLNERCSGEEAIHFPQSSGTHTWCGNALRILPHKSASTNSSRKGEGIPVDVDLANQQSFYNQNKHHGSTKQVSTYEGTKTKQQSMKQDNTQSNDDMTLQFNDGDLTTEDGITLENGNPDAQLRSKTLAIFVQQA